MHVITKVNVFPRSASVPCPVSVPEVTVPYLQLAPTRVSTRPTLAFVFGVLVTVVAVPVVVPHSVELGVATTA
jgi:hypothetical protein